MRRISFLPALLILILGFTISCDLSNEKEPSAVPFPCTDGVANGYFCENVDLYAHLSLDELNLDTTSVEGADIWGWTDPSTQKEYAIVALTNGVTFVDVSNPAEPVVVGKLKEQFNAKAKSSLYKYRHDEEDEGKGASLWRDVKVFDNYAFVVSDAQPTGLQVFDLTRLRETSNIPYTYEEDARYSEFEGAHNIAINEESGFAYVVGSNTYGGGLHIIDINNPLQPAFAGFHADTTIGYRKTGYVHDTQCVIYNGPDTDYEGDELCFNASETHLVVANVSDKQNTYSISKKSYENYRYAHQGWLTEDHRYFLLDDELDYGNTTTYIWDMQDLDDPQLIGTHVANSSAIDHNQYVHQGYSYQSNYTSGLRILDLSDIANANLTEKAYFDTYPSDNARKFDGNWSNYPFFSSGIVVLSDISNGLFIVRPNLD